MKHGMLTVAVLAALSLSSSANAKDPIKEVSIQEQAKDFVAGKETISKEELINRGREINDRQSTLRIEEGFSNIKDGAKKAEFQLKLTEDQLLKQQFIMENVPVEYRIAGEAETLAYIRSKFIDKVVSDGPDYSTDTVWESSQNNLIVPNSTQPVWTPVVKEVVVAQRMQKDPEPLPKETITESQTEEAKELLDVSIDDLAKIFEGVTLDSKPKIDNVPAPVDVFIEKVDVKRVLITGRSKVADVDVRFMVINGEQKRTVEKTFSNVEPGYRFEVDGINFVLSDLSRDNIIFSNIDEDKNFSHIIN